MGLLDNSLRGPMEDPTYADWFRAKWGGAPPADVPPAPVDAPPPPPDAIPSPPTDAAPPAPASDPVHAALLDRYRTAQTQDREERAKVSRYALASGLMGNKVDPKLLADPTQARDVEGQVGIEHAVGGEERAAALAVPQLASATAKATEEQARAPFAGPRAEADARLAGAHADVYAQTATKGKAELEAADQRRAALGKADSDESRMARDLASTYLKSLNPNAPPIAETVPGSRILEMLPHLEKPYAAKLRAQATVDAAKVRGGNAPTVIIKTDPYTGKPIVLDRRTGKPVDNSGDAPPAAPEALEPPDKNTKRFEATLKKDLDAAAASSRSVFGSAGGTIFRGAKILPLLQQTNKDGTPRQLTQPEWQSVAAAFVGMETGGVPPERMTFGIVPQDAAGSWAKVQSWFTAEPYAPDRQKWIDLFVNNINREDGAAQREIERASLQRIGANSEFATAQPNRMKQIVRSYGFDPSLVEQVKAGTYAGPGPRAGAGGAKELSPEDAKALSWAKANPNDPRAAKILKRLGVSGG